MSEGVEWGVHCAVLLVAVPPDRTLSTARLAEFHGVPVHYLAKHLQAMTRAGLLESVPGPRGGYRLAAPADEITLLDIVEAIDGREPAFTCTEIRRRGPTAAPASWYRLPCGIHAAMDRADEAWRDQLRRTTLADLARGVLTDVDPRSLAKGATWLREAVR